MAIEILLSSYFFRSTWSGGETIQLAIFPNDSLYSNPDFLWRISTATTNLQESNFTPLPSYNRLISVIDGSLRLESKEIDLCSLSPGDIFSFDGAMPIKSYGICQDFNVMTKKGHCQGELHHISLSPHETTQLGHSRSLSSLSSHEHHWIFLYSIKGNIRLMDKDGTVDLPQDSLARLTLSTICYNLGDQNASFYAIHLKG